MAFWNKVLDRNRFVLNSALIATFTFVLSATGFCVDPYKISEQVYDFGQVGIDYKIFHNFKLTNISQKAFQIDSVDVPCDCSSVLFAKKLVKPKESVDLQLTFDTKDFYGPVNRKFIVFLSIPERRTIILFYLAEVGQWKNGLKPEPFAVFMLPTHKQQTVKINNKYFDKIKAEVQNIHSNEFTVELTKAEANKNGALEISVIPDPALKNGTYLSNFTLKITTGEGEEPTYLTIPVKIARF